MIWPSEASPAGRGALRRPIVRAASRGATVVAWIAIAIVLVTTISIVDHLTGPGFTFSLFYLGVLALVSWKVLEEPGAVAGAVVIAAVWSIADWFTLGSLYVEVLTWNGCMRGVVLASLGIIVCRFRNVLLRERALARTDFLTGTLNARAFSERATLEVSRARRHRRPLTVVYVDVDDFKSVNDRFGHGFGDEVLREVAAILRSHVRDSDCVSRIGGDEFIVLLPEVGREHARSTLSKLLHALREVSRNPEVPITCSAGAVVFNPPPADLDSLIRQSDEMMYHAKARGKNRLHMH